MRKDWTTVVEEVVHCELDARTYDPAQGAEVVVNHVGEKKGIVRCERGRRLRWKVAVRAADGEKKGSGYESRSRGVLDFEHAKRIDKEERFFDGQLEVLLVDKYFGGILEN